jgi:mannose-6-phosphate isomerase-like protein (cupin superfamily)
MVPNKTDKPWGFELLWAFTDRYAGKILHVDPGQRLSLQYHNNKDETLYLLSGRMQLELEDERGALVQHAVEPGESFRVAAGRRHRIHAIEACNVLEASTPELDDVVRIQDEYGRV